MDGQRRPNRKPREGFIMPTVVVSITIMSLVIVAALGTASDERRASRAVRESTLSIYVAEAGLRQTYGSWPVGPVKSLNPGDTLDLGWHALPNKGSYRAVIHRVDNGGLQEYNVVVQGKRTGLSGGVSTVVGVVGGVPIFSRAIFGDTLVYIDGGSTVDAYDSELGAYNSATADTTADIATNRDVYVKKATVKGNISAVGSINLGTTGVTVTGTKAPGAAAVPVYDIIPCPMTSGGAYAYSPKTAELSGPGITYSDIGPSAGALTVGAGAVLTLSQPSYFFKSVAFVGNSTIKVPGDPHVDIMVRDSVVAAGGTFVNQGHNATDLSLTACGTPSDPSKGNYWSITGGADAYFSVYAPNHVVYGLGSSDFYGAIISSLFYVGGGASVHYDAALARAPSRKLAVQKATWAQYPGN